MSLRGLSASVPWQGYRPVITRVQAAMPDPALAESDNVPETVRFAHTGDAA